MKLFLSFFFKYLLSSRAGSVIRLVCIICICSLAVSLAGLLIVISVMSGFGLSIRDRLLQKEPHLVVWAPSQKINHLKNLLQNNQLEQDVEVMRIFETQDVILKTSSGEITGAIAKGYTKNNLQQMASHFEIKDSNSSSLAPQIHISMDLTHQLDLYEGDILFLFPAENLLLPPTEMALPEKIQVSSIISLSNSSMDNKTLMYEIGSIPSLKQNSSLEKGIEIFLKNPIQYHKHQQILQKSGYSAQSWSERNSSLFFALKVEKWIMIIFLSLAALIASFSIASMAQLLLHQKKKDIEILMVMGYPIPKIKKLFRSIAFFMSFFGVSSGLIIGYLVCLFLKYVPINLLPDIYVDRKIPVEISLELFGVVFLLACFLSYFASWIPMHFYIFRFSTDAMRETS